MGPLEQYVSRKVPYMRLGLGGEAGVRALGFEIKVHGFGAGVPTGHWLRARCG